MMENRNVKIAALLDSEVVAVHYLKFIIFLTIWALD